VDDLRYLGMWFDPKSIADLASIVWEVSKIRSPLYRGFFCVCLSNILRSVSWQKATDLRVRKEILPYDMGTAQERFLAEAMAQVDRIRPYLSVLKHQGPAKVEIRRGNAVDVASMFPEYWGKVDLLITSPPYATALPYLDTDRLSLIVLRLLPRKKHGEVERDMVGTREVSERERREAWAVYESRRADLPEEISALIDRIAEANHGEGVGFRRRNLPALLGKYFLSMLDAMRSAREMMKRGAYGYYVVGNNSTEVGGEKIEIPTNRFLFDLGAAAGWAPVEQIPMELIVSRDIFRENRGSSETILCFQA
jgi:site-specific DNA-methyltransferase (cytosine-N4-specific)